MTKSIIYKHVFLCQGSPSLKVWKGRELRVGEHLKVKLSRLFLDGISGIRKCRVSATHRDSSIKKYFENLFCTAYQIRSFGAYIENPAMAFSL